MIMKARKWEILAALFTGAIVGAAGSACGAARADTPSVVQQPCSGSVTVFGVLPQGGSEVWHSVPAAILDLPGRGWQDLYASVTAVPPPTGGIDQAVKGYTSSTQISPPRGFFVKDGEVAVACETAQSTVTFVVH